MRNVRVRITVRVRARNRVMVNFRIRVVIRIRISDRVEVGACVRGSAPCLPSLHVAACYIGMKIYRTNLC